MEESQGKPAEADFPEQVRQHRQKHGEDKSLHERVAELLRNSGYEEQHRKAEWMAVSKDTNVYLETMEAARNTKAEADGIGTSGMGCLRGSIQP